MCKILFKISYNTKRTIYRDDQQNKENLYCIINFSRVKPNKELLLMTVSITVNIACNLSIRVFLPQ